MVMLQSRSFNIMKLATRTHSAMNTQCFEKIMEVNPEDAFLLLNTTKLDDPKESLYAHSLKYRTHYVGKRFIFDPDVASDICSVIKANSEGDSSTPLIEADGGLYLIARKFRQVSDRPLVIFDRDPEFSQLHSKLLSGINDLTIENINYVQLQAMSMKEKELYDSTFTHVSSKYRNGWNNPTPGFTLFASLPHQFIPYLAMKALYSWDHMMKRHPLNDCQDLRPEYFFIIPSRTAISLKWYENSCTMPFYALFRTLFDYQFLNKYPYTAFLPWHTGTVKSGRSRMGKLIYEERDLVYLMRARPKEDIGLTPDTLDGFRAVDLLQWLSMLKNRKVERGYLIPNLEKFLPGVGFDLIKDGGVKLSQKSFSIPSSKIIPLFNILRRQSDYESSSFVTYARAVNDLNELKLA